MLDSSIIGLQRTRGEAVVGLSDRGMPVRLRQAGSAKAFLPKVHDADTEVVFLNTAGGLTGGDTMSFALSLAGGRATGTTQTAERAYRSASGVAELTVSLDVGAGGHLDWLPQETILFDGSALHRSTNVRLHGDASFLMCEAIVLGRGAMGETIRTVELRDRRSIFRNGTPVHLEPLAFATEDLAAPGPAGFALGSVPARALASIALIARGAEDALTAVRSGLESSGVLAHATAWNGKLVVRAMASDATPLRRMIAGLLEQLRGGPLPRVWQV